MKQSGKAVVNPPILMKKIHAAKSLGWRQVKDKYRQKDYLVN